MASLNKLQIIGHLGKDPEIRHTGDGRAIANFSVATSETWKDKSGEKVTHTDWHNVVIFWPLSETAEKYLVKGSLVYLEGKSQTRKWTDKNGNDKWTTELVVDRGGKMQMLGKGGTDAKDEKPADDFDSDIPF